VTSPFNLHSLLRNYLKLFGEDSCVLIHFITFTKCFKIVDGYTVADPGFCVRGTKVGEGSGDRLRSPAGPGQSRGRRPWELLGFEYLGSFSVNNFEAFCECDEVY
jgi:hypothetical protein